MSLDEWQLRLRSHFQQLRRKRIERPLFGLEHGLDEAELKIIKNEIRAHISAKSLILEHALPWVVYASEIGYGYSGDEYWQTFAEETPGWEEHGDRYFIRKCFQYFNQNYGGARPAGVWAKHFNIICWPITHAILPKDLQRQLAKILYEVRHSLSSKHFSSPSELGQLIAARGWDANSRFQQLAQEYDLIGQISAALLLGEDKDSDDLILSKTLRRIRADLDRERRARDWLKVAQRSAQIQFDGLAKDNTRKDLRAHPDKKYVQSLGIEPRLVLRPKMSSWEVWIEIPDLSHLLDRFPEFRDALTNSRYVVTGSSSGRPFARGGLIFGTSLVRLKEWPAVETVLICFEHSVDMLDTLLSTECLIRPGPLWLFKIGSDGLGHEIRGNQVRAGQKYVILTTNNDILTRPVITPTAVLCAGISAAEITLPSAISIELGKQLKAFGLNQVQKIEVWPAGLVAASWDGDGRGEWLSNDEPIIGIRSDYERDRFVVRLNNDSSKPLDVVPHSVGEPVFIGLPKLSVGYHELEVCAQPKNGLHPEETAYLEVVIRDPIPWRPGVGTQGALHVVVEPVNPSLEDVWEGRATVEIFGPVSRQVHLTLSLQQKTTDKPLVANRLPNIPLPCTSQKWKTYFERHARQIREVQNCYDIADSIIIRIDGDELGCFQLMCEREFRPLRWIIRRISQGCELQLADNRGEVQDCEVFRYDFASPLSAIRLKSSDFKKLHPTSEAGLYLATSGPCSSSVIIPQPVRSFTDLRYDPHIILSGNSLDNIHKILNAIALWSTARITGELRSRLQRRQVLLAFTRHLFGIIGGKHWAEAERLFFEKPSEKTYLALKRSISAKRSEMELGLVLDKKRSVLINSTLDDRISELVSLAIGHLQLPIPSKFQVSPIRVSPFVKKIKKNEPAKWLCEFALRLASDPYETIDWANEHLDNAVDCLAKVPTLARGARFMVLATSLGVQARTDENLEIYPGWEWS